MVDEPKQQEPLKDTVDNYFYTHGWDRVFYFGHPFDKLRGLSFYDVPSNDDYAKNNVEAEANVADEMGDFTDILVVVLHVTEEAELRGHKHRKHINEHHQVETLAVKRLHTRHDKGHDQNGQLDAEVFRCIFKVGSP